LVIKEIFVNRNKIFQKAAVFVAISLLTTSCVAGPNSLENVPGSNGKVAGFFNGWWDGTIAPITFVISLFNKNVEIYNPNSNGWYPFGFMIGVGGLPGGVSVFSRRK
jgi:hypothetical protein